MPVFIMGKRPTILLVHGAFSTPLLLQYFIIFLKNHEIDVECPLLPSCDAGMNASNPNLDMYDDAERIFQDLWSLVELEGKLVLLVAHCYGGLPATQGATEEMGYSQRRAIGKEGGDNRHPLYLRLSVPRRGVHVR